MGLRYHHELSKEVSVVIKRAIWLNSLALKTKEVEKLNAKVTMECKNQMDR
jgi:hypothetical protein